ncbi:MAG TPA: hypothetical protein VMF32_24885 [Xanthobacteraceae bacterium]|nr:hypothetical protein [Xanthobacteraceae bacterium]
MSLRRKMRAIGAVVAAYTVALQAIFLGIAGLVAGPVDSGASFGVSSLCLFSRTAAPHPTPGGHEHDCSAACAACCCSAPVASASAPAIAYEKVPAGLIAAATVIVPTWRFGADRAHRSRAPPLS